jgi:hypothetical protein
VGVVMAHRTLSCTSAIREIDFAFGSKNSTGVSQLARLWVEVSIDKSILSFFGFLDLYGYGF